VHVAGVCAGGIVRAGLRLLLGGSVGVAAVAGDLGGLLLGWEAGGGERSVSVVGGWGGGCRWLLLLMVLLLGLVVEEAWGLGRVGGELLDWLAEGGLAVEGCLIWWW
jgi:hypothetical protein